MRRASGCTNLPICTNRRTTTAWVLKRLASTADPALHTPAAEPLPRPIAIAPGADQHCFASHIHSSSRMFAPSFRSDSEPPVHPFATAQGKCSLMFTLGTDADLQLSP